MHPNLSETPETMPDTSAIPVRHAEEPAAAKRKLKAEVSDASAPTAVTASGPRKLIRPQLSAAMVAARSSGRVATVSPLPLIHGRWNPSATEAQSSHAEAFYFQKQIHSQTLMIFVLEDGQQIQGYIEWYDRNSIKVQHGARTLIYKASIKYLYKAADSGSL